MSTPGDGACESSGFSILLFYFYTDSLPTSLGLSPSDLEAARAAHEALCHRFRLNGRLRVSVEGLNGNLSGAADLCNAYCDFLRAGAQQPEASPLARSLLAEAADSPNEATLSNSMASCDFKVAPCLPQHRFRGLKVWTANEVTGLWGDQTEWTPELEAERAMLANCPPGEHLEAPEFQRKLAEASAKSGDSGAVLFDARNIYETRVGHFAVPGVDLVDPGTRNFSDLRSYFQDERNLEKLRGKQVFMYCTGGVRCERSSALLRRAGVADAVYQLSGGIQRYMEQYPRPCAANAGDDSVDTGATAGDGSRNTGDAASGFFVGKMHVFDRRGCVAPDGTCGSIELKHDWNTPTNTISRCLLCARLWDQYKGKRRCASCGTLVLVCEHCQSSSRDGRTAELRCELCPPPKAAVTVV